MSPTLAPRGRTDGRAATWRRCTTRQRPAMDGEPWSFPEYLHGRTHVAEGTRLQGWSAAGAVMAHRALAGSIVLAERPGA